MLTAVVIGWALACSPSFGQDSNRRGRIVQDYGDAVFQVFRLPEGPAVGAEAPASASVQALSADASQRRGPAATRTAIGTATLVDSRGYLITASHTLLRPGVSESDQACRDREHNEVLEIRNSRGLTLQARPVAVFPHGRLDFAILHIKDTERAFEHIRVPDLAIGDQTQRDGLTDFNWAFVIGYSLGNISQPAEVTGYGEVLTARPSRTFKLGFNTAQEGFSGGPVFSHAERGAVMGVLVGEGVLRELCQGDAVAGAPIQYSDRHLDATRISGDVTEAILAHIPPSERAQSLAGAVRGIAPLRLDLLRDLRDGRVSSIDLAWTVRILRAQQGPAQAQPVAFPSSRADQLRVLDWLLELARARQMNGALVALAAWCPNGLTDEPRCIERSADAIQVASAFLSPEEGRAAIRVLSALSRDVAPRDTAQAEAQSRVLELLARLQLAHGAGDFGARVALAEPLLDRAARLDPLNMGVVLARAEASALNRQWGAARRDLTEFREAREEPAAIERGPRHVERALVESRRELDQERVSASTARISARLY